MEKIKVDKIKEQAQTLGLTDLPRKTLYARPRIATIRKALYYPEPAEVVEHYMQYSLGVESFLHARQGRKTREYYYLSPEASLYVEVFDKIAGFQPAKDENHINQLNIYSKAPEHVQKIANFTNEIFPLGLLSSIVWEKIEKKFEVSREKCIADWEKLLLPPEETLKQAKDLGLTNQKETVLYTLANKTEKKFGKNYPDVVWAVRSYMHAADPALVESTLYAEKSNIYYFLAPELRIFVQINYKGPMELKICCDQAEHIRGIAKTIDSLFKKGLLAKIKWKNIKKQFAIDEATCIAAWKRLL
jgi:hypothetical protein